MATNYPAALDTTTQLENDRANTTLTVNDHAGQHNNISDALIAVETALGTAPKGTYADVKTRLNDGVVKTPAADQIIMPSTDNVGVVSKVGASQTVSNVFEGRKNDNSVVFFVDRNGGVSAASYKVAGTLLNSTHLSDSAALARLAGPVFTGDPQAPTPTAGDSDTSIATTAFVTGAISTATAGVVGFPIGGVMDWPWGSGAIPSWSLLPFGQTVLKATYPALNTVASDASAVYPYSSDSTHFNMPDYRGRVGTGKDNMGGSAASRVTSAVSGVDGATVGAVGGLEGVTLVTGNLPAHNHSVTGSPSLTDPGHTHTLNTDSVVKPGTSEVNASGPATVFDPASPTINSNTTGITVGVGTLGTSNTGSGSTHQNMQPTVVVNKIMRVN